MSVSLTVNGVAFPYPQTGDPAPWGDGVQQWASAVTTGMLQKAGGNFTLTADVNFGPNFGLLSQYFTSRSANAAAAGVARFSNTDTINFRNFAASADNSLGTNVSDRLTYNTVAVPTISSTDTLTNKTMSGAANTLSNIAYSSLTLGGNIVNADINAAAAIAYSKLALTGAMQNADLAAAVSIAKGGTGQTAQTAGFDALAPTTTKGDIIVRGASNNVRLAIGSDGQVPVADATATNGLAWKTLQQGAKNYITYNNFENNSTTGWSLGNAGTLTNGIPTGTPTFGSGNSGNLSMAVVSSGQLAGSYSLSYVSSAATTLADMLASQAYTIDIEDQAKVLSFKFYYKAFSGAANCNFSGTSSNSFGVAVYDVTNSAWLGTAGQFSMVQSSGVGICQGTFQTGSTTASIRLVVYNITATSGAATMYLDDFYVGPQALAFGPAMSDWVAFTPTVANLGAGSYTTSARYRRVGDSVEIFGQFDKDGTPGSGAIIVTCSLPSGITGDTSKAPSSGYIGSGQSYNAQMAAAYQMTSVSLASSTTLTFIKEGTNANLKGADFLAGSQIIFSCIVPVVGFSSNTVMSADSDTRVVAARYNSSAATSFAASTNVTVPFGTVDYDTHGAFNTSTNKYVCPVSGYYRVSFMLNFASAAWTAGNRIEIDLSNGTSGVTSGLVYFIQPASITNSRSVNGTGIAKCNAGDQLYLNGFQNEGTARLLDGTTALNWVSFERLSGPAVVAATESVNLRVSCASGQSLANGAPSEILWDTQVYSSHGGYSTITGRYTIPVSGTYRVSAFATFALLAWTIAGGAQAIELYLYKNGSSVCEMSFTSMPYAGSYRIGTMGSTEFKFNAGDTLSVALGHQESTARALLANGSVNHMTVSRVGN